MKIIEIRCPSCAAPVETDLEKTRKYRCGYCRNQFYLQCEGETIPNNITGDCIFVDLREKLEEVGLASKFNQLSISPIKPLTVHKLSKAFMVIFLIMFVTVFLFIISVFLRVR